MDDEQAAPIGSRVHGLVAELDSSERERREVTSKRIVVARDVDDRRPLAYLAQDLLHDVVVRLRPEPAPAQLPAVDDVTDEVELLRLGVAQEIEKEQRLTGRAPEVQIRDPDG